MTWTDCLVLASLFGAVAGLYTWLVLLNPHRIRAEHEQD